MAVAESNERRICNAHRDCPVVRRGAMMVPVEAEWPNVDGKGMALSRIYTETPRTSNDDRGKAKVT